MGEIDNGRVCRECHPGAIYLHRGRTWEVTALDFVDKEVVVCVNSSRYYTLPLSSKKTDILENISRNQCFGLDIFFGKVRVTERITGYQKKQNQTGRVLKTATLDLPEQVLETTGVWLNMPSTLANKMEEEKYHFMGALHALEHAMIALFPLVVLCDCNDIGGISITFHPQTESASIFVYDGYSDGINLAFTAYEKMEILLPQTLQTITGCSCTTGCPSCVHSPKCGSGNRPIDKNASLFLLESILSGTYCSLSRKSPLKIAKNVVDDSSRQSSLLSLSLEKNSGLAALPETYGVFDLETIRFAAEVGGWGQIEKMGISVGVVYDSRLDDYVTYLEPEVPRLIDHLREFELVVGFNNKRFDNQVLAGYQKESYLERLPNLDLLEEVQDQLGYRLKLQALATATLGVGKSGDGLDALRWYQEGRIDLLQKYCRMDVEITKALLLFALENGYLLFSNKAKQTVRIPLQLNTVIARLL